MIVDVHAHAIPPDFVDYLLAGSGGAGDAGVSAVSTERGDQIVFGNRTTAPLSAALSDMDRRIKWMDRVGLDVQIMAGWIDLTGYEVEAAHAVNYSRAHNDSLAAHVEPHADRFWTIGTVPLQDPRAAADELEHLMASGFVGIEIATTVRGVALDAYRTDPADGSDPIGLDPVWEVAEATGAFVLLHPMTPLTGVDLNRYFMDNAVARPAETTIALAGLIMSGVFERYPGLKVCAVHGGGFVPYQIGRLDQAVKAKPELAGPHLSRLPSDYLRHIYVDTVVNNPAVLRFMIDYLGAEQVMLGTDYPFPMGDLDPVASVDEVADLSDVERSLILGGNAAQLCGH